MSYIFPAQGYGTNNITSYFGNRKAPTAGATTYHRGVDIGAAAGTNVLAAAAGKVIGTFNNSAKGNYIQIKHANGDITEYEHLNGFNVVQGQDVSAGQKIGTVGSTGISTGPHLHFGVISGGSYVNPLSWGGSPMPTNLSSADWFRNMTQFNTATPGPLLGATDTSDTGTGGTSTTPFNFSGENILAFIKKYFLWILAGLLVYAVITKKR